MDSLGAAKAPPKVTPKAKAALSSAAALPDAKASSSSLAASHGAKASSSSPATLPKAKASSSSPAASPKKTPSSSCAAASPVATTTLPSPASQPKAKASLSSPLALPKKKHNSSYVVASPKKKPLLSSDNSSLDFAESDCLRLVKAGLPAPPNATTELWPERIQRELAATEIQALVRGQQARKKLKKPELTVPPTTVSKSSKGKGKGKGKASVAGKGGGKSARTKPGKSGAGKHLVKSAQRRAVSTTAGGKASAKNAVEKRRQEAAATKIQARVRGQQARKKTNKMKAKRLGSKHSSSRSRSPPAAKHADARRQKAATIKKQTRGPCGPRDKNAPKLSRTAEVSKRKQGYGLNSLSKQVDLDCDGVVSRTDLKRAASAGIISPSSDVRLLAGSGNGMDAQARLNFLEEEADKLRKMLVKVSPAKANKPNSSRSAARSSSPANKPNSSRSTARSSSPAKNATQLPNSVKIAAKGPTSARGLKKMKPLGKDKNPKDGLTIEIPFEDLPPEEQLQRWLMNRVETPEQRGDMLKQFQQWSHRKSRPAEPLASWSQILSSKAQGNKQLASWSQTSKRGKSPPSSKGLPKHAKSLPTFKGLSRSRSMEVSRTHSPHKRQQQRSHSPEKHARDSEPEHLLSASRWTRWLKPHERDAVTFEFVAEPGVTNLGVIPEILLDGRVVANQVQSWGWAWRKGLKCGDELVELDDQLASEMSDAQLRWALVRRPLRLAFRKCQPTLPEEAATGEEFKDGRRRWIEDGDDETTRQWFDDGADETRRSREDSLLPREGFHEESTKKCQSRRSPDGSHDSEDSEEEQWQPAAPREPKKRVQAMDGGQLLTLTPKDVLQFDQSPITVALRGSFRIANTSPFFVAFKVKTTAPKSYHLVEPRSRTLRPGEMQDIKTVFKPRGIMEAVAPDYCFVIQATMLQEYREVSNDEFLKEYESRGLVEEHRLLVLFKGATKWRPPKTSCASTGTTQPGPHGSSRPGAHAVFDRLHAMHANKVQKDAELREAGKQRKIAEFETALLPVRQATSSEIDSISERMCDEGRRKSERLIRQRLQKLEKEQNSLLTPYNHSKTKFIVGSDGPWEDWFRREERVQKNLESERQQLHDKQSQYLEENSVHRNAEAANDIACERLYLDFFDRQSRDYAKQQQEAARELANCLRTIGDPASVNAEEVMHRLLQDGQRRLDGMRWARQKIDREFLVSAGIVETSPETRARADVHAAHLHDQWERHQDYMLLLRDRFLEVQEEILRRQSVHAQAPDDWGPDDVEELVQRLYPETAVTHPHKDRATKATERQVRATAKATAKKKAMKKLGLRPPPPSPPPTPPPPTPPPSPPQVDTLNDALLMTRLIGAGVRQAIDIDAEPDVSALSPLQALPQYEGLAGTAPATMAGMAPSTGASGRGFMKACW